MPFLVNVHGDACPPADPLTSTFENARVPAPACGLVANQNDGNAQPIRPRNFK
jgi:hypothetical protein